MDFYQLVGTVLSVIYITVFKISSFCSRSKDNKSDCMTSSFDYSNDCSLLEVFFSKEQYSKVSPLITHLRISHLIRGATCPLGFCFRNH